MSHHSLVYRPEPERTKAKILCDVLRTILPGEMSVVPISVVPLDTGLPKTTLTRRDLIRVIRQPSLTDGCSLQHLDRTPVQDESLREICLDGKRPIPPKSPLEPLAQGKPIQGDLFAPWRECKKNSSRTNNPRGETNPLIGQALQTNSTLRIEIANELLEEDTPEWVMHEVIRSIIGLGLGVVRTRTRSFFFAVSRQLELWVDQKRSQGSLLQPRQRPISPPSNRSRKRSDAELLQRWRAMRAEYFPDRPEIDLYSIVWSARVQRSVLASCNPERRHVTVARTMLRQECLPYLDALLFHEMCHAHAGIQIGQNGRRIMHGRRFRELELLHPEIPALDRWIENRGWASAVERDRRAERYMRNRSSRGNSSHTTTSNRGISAGGTPHNPMKKRTSRRVPVQSCRLKSAG